MEDQMEIDLVNEVDRKIDRDERKLDEKLEKNNAEIGRSLYRDVQNEECIEN